MRRGRTSKPFLFQFLSTNNNWSDSKFIPHSPDFLKQKFMAVMKNCSRNIKTSFNRFQPSLFLN